MANECPEAANLRRNIDICADRLREHCDSVVIIVTKHDADSSGTTKGMVARRGNYYACRDSVREFLVTENEKDREVGRQEVRGGDDEETV